MFKLFNNYPLAKLLKRVQWNARAMFAAYALFIGAGVVGAVFAVNNTLGSSWVGMLMVVMMLAAGLLLMAPFLLFDYFRHKRRKCSLFMQDKASLEMWDFKIRESEKIGERLGVSKAYIFSMCSTFYIPSFFPKDTIEAIYSRRYYRKGRLLSDPNIYIICQGNKLYKLPMGGRLITEKGGLLVEKDTQALDEWILSRMHAHMPHVLFGFFYAQSLTKKADALVPLYFNGS